MLRTGLHKSPINQGKKAAVTALHRAYQDTAHRLANGQWRLLFENGRLDKNAKLRVSSVLSARYIQTCQYQVVAVLAGYLGNCAEMFKRAVRGASLSQEVQVQLLYLNKYKLWYKKEVKMQGVSLPVEVLRLARNIMRGVFKRCRKPRVSGINLALDEKVATLEVADTASTFPYWVKLSTLQAGKPIRLPVAANPWFAGIQGEVKAFVQLNRLENGDYVVGVIKEINASPYQPKLDMLGLDVGMNVLLATSEGDLLGQGVFDKLVRWDTALTRLARNRQKAGLPVRSRRYDSQVSRMRAFLKNEVHRTLRAALLKHRPACVSVEVLDFRSPRLSRRMNRLVQNFGRSVFNDALAKFSEEYGFEVADENPAYSSKACSQCHYVDDRNREGDRFCCLHCGYHTHADVNAANNHAQRARFSRRSGCVNASKYVKREAILQSLVKGFATRKRLAYLRRMLIEHPELEKQRRRHSSPCLCMLTNPYFKDVLAPIVASAARVRSRSQPL